MAPGNPRKRDSNSALDPPSGEKSSADVLQGPLGDPLVTVGFLALVLPLFFHLTVAQTLNPGAASPSRTMDYVAICGGVIADACGSLLLIKALLGRRRGTGNPSKTSVRLAVALIISALGIVHLLRGLGLIKLGLLG